MWQEFDHSRIPMPSDNETIFKYMDITKLLHLLDKQSIFFARPEQFVDKHEALIPIADTKELKTLLINDGFSTGETDMFISERLSEVEQERDNFGITCFQLYEEHHEAMWDRYAAGHTGVTIRSTVRKLKDSLSIDPGIQYMGKLNYGASDDCFIDTFYYLFYKRTIYTEERELRVVTDLTINNNQYVKVDPSILIDEIIVTPKAKDWQFEAIKGTLERAFPFLIGKIRKSNFYDYSY